MQFSKNKNKKIIALALATFMISSSLGGLVSNADTVEQTETISGTQHNLIEQGSSENADSNIDQQEGVASTTDFDQPQKSADTNIPDKPETTSNLSVTVNEKAIKTGPGGFNGFVKENGKWYFYTKNIQTKGWVNYKGNKYYILNTYTLPQNMWRTINGKRYYFNKDGVMIKDQKVVIDGKTYQFNAEGHMIDPNNNRVVGQVTPQQENLYKLGAKTLTEDIKNVKSGLLREDNKWYKYENGKKTRGWFQEGNYKYYFLNTFNRAENIWRTISGKTYYFDANGRMYANTIKYIGGKTYKFNQDGSLNASAKTTLITKDVAVTASADSKSNTVAKFVKGSGVEIISNSGNYSQVKSSNGQVQGWIPVSAYISASQEKINKVIEVAKSKIGSPYVWGATGPSTFDCSGLMLYSFNKGANVTLPRVSRDQARAGEFVSRENLRAGDMIFWGSPVHHVGLYIGDGKYIHAPQPGTSVTIAKLGSYTTARRVIK